ncbi:hypothetical protein EK21DRAFT_118697 [Setomelanomma holmii]|uniref:Heterokaryon incompatibility domain-containing protein n=1 Tax=Setomelanomma holmii TaxID=210430 RepID=A0A9P4GX22_9PLEO|nr:hypothetical protein EK21DRAFT_118697 [Setomelanomma holmii]
MPALLRRNRKSACLELKYDNPSQPNWSFATPRQMGADSTGQAGVDFIALSYEWGELEQQMPYSIEIDGYDFPVRENLMHFLNVFPEHRKHRELPAVLWIDSICIDQTDSQEKADQIRMIQETVLGRQWFIACGNDIVDGEQLCSIVFSTETSVARYFIRWRMSKASKFLDERRRYWNYGAASLFDLMLHFFELEATYTVDKVRALLALCSESSAAERLHTLLEQHSAAFDSDINLRKVICKELNRLFTPSPTGLWELEMHADRKTFLDAVLEISKAGPDLLVVARLLASRMEIFPASYSAWQRSAVKRLDIRASAETDQAGRHVSPAANAITTSRDRNHTQWLRSTVLEPQRAKVPSLGYLPSTPHAIPGSTHYRSARMRPSQRDSPTGLSGNMRLASLDFNPSEPGMNVQRLHFSSLLTLPGGMYLDGTSMSDSLKPDESNVLGTGQDASKSNCASAGGSTSPSNDVLEAIQRFAREVDALRAEIQTTQTHQSD